MPTTATARKSTATAPKAPRKTRARKAKATTPVAKVTTTTYQGGKVTKRVTELKRPSTRNLISADRYLKDIQTRWAIHQFEIQELGKDLRKGFDFVTPYRAQLVKQVKAWTV